jgi:pimeloyl-ACP methyl ester carboxylesterase
MPFRTVHNTAQLTLESAGAGVPVVFLHGLTFDRQTWRPIINRLDDGLRTITIDLPGHGDSPGKGGSLDRLASLIADTLDTVCGGQRPILVGHSMSGVLALKYASRYGVRGVVTVGQSWNVRPFAEMVRQMAPALCGEGFSDAFRPFERTIGIHLLSQPERARVLERRCVTKELVFDYWGELLDSDPVELQNRIDCDAASISAPCLAVFGHELSDDERCHMTSLVPGIQVQEWPGGGHMVHLVEPARFAARLLKFIDDCTGRFR